MANDMRTAIIKMMKAYWKDEPKGASPTPAPVGKYNKKYFDTIAKDHNLPMDDHQPGGKNGL